MYRVSCGGCSASVINGTPSHESGCHGFFEFKRGGRTYHRYRLWSLDTLGNPRDGFEVNDRRDHGIVTLPAEPSDKQIVQALKAKDMLNKRCHTRSFRIDGDDRALSVDWAKTGEPLFSLEAL